MNLQKTDNLYFYEMLFCIPAHINHILCHLCVFSKIVYLDFFSLIDVTGDAQ